jgi:cysteine synthase A
MKVVDNILDARCNTPMVRLRRIVPNDCAEILAKVEFFGPSGSVKDRIAAFMIEEAEKRGDLKPGYRIIEATTGNTGIAFALAGLVKGYRVTVVMPEGMSEERKKVVRAYGAEIVFTSGSETAVDRCVEKVEELRSSDGKVWVPGQFTSLDNVRAHQRTTGPEIIKQAGRDIEAFVAGVGSGGTLMGVARCFKEEGIKAKIVAVEPEECAVMSGGRNGPHRIEGIGDGFVPEIVDINLITDIEVVSDGDAINMARRLAREEGILGGISSGANVAAAINLGKRLGKGRKVVTLIPDTGMRYFSTDLFKEE